MTFREKRSSEAFQHEIRIKIRDEYINSGKPKFWENIDLSLKKAVVKEVNRKTAEKIILQYEWLGDMAITNRYYGIFFENFCAGVICINSNGVCPNNAKQFGIKDSECSYFARGACTFWSPVGTASKLLSFACKLEKKKGAKVCIGFADTDAGEYGTVYQACNWICLGRQKVENFQITKGNKVIDSRTISQKARKSNIAFGVYLKMMYDLGWVKQIANLKYRYIRILADGDDYRKIFEKIKIHIEQYPKRTHAALDHLGDHLVTSQEGAFDATMPLKKSTKKLQCQEDAEN